MTSVVPLTGMMVVVIIIMGLVAAGKRHSHHNQQGGKTQYFLCVYHIDGFALYISKNLPSREIRYNQPFGAHRLWELGIVLPRKYFICIETNGSIVNRKEYLKNWATDFQRSGYQSFDYKDASIRIFHEIRGRLFTIIMNVFYPRVSL
jgi:hypothetical protein